MTELDHAVYTVCRYWSIYRFCLKGSSCGIDRAYPDDHFRRCRKPSETTAVRAAFHMVCQFVFANNHVYWWSRADLENRNYYTPEDEKDEEAFAEIEPWLQEHCPSFTGLGPLIGIQDDDEAFAYRMRFG
ncbi:hypothetical protein [Methylobacterium sp. B1]|uniref:hypothetical protein n=1 Tax=Methylobacterium sp. B1 TaxID=91459 RepID=UPI0011D23FF5|nr:hypothetical protein [Methylobacterium sp. B1]